MKKIAIVFTITTLVFTACSSGNSNSTATEATTTEATTEAASSEVVIPADINDLLSKNTCLSCHSANDKVVGPPYVEVAKRNYTSEEIVALIYKPNPSHWPEYQTPMIGLPNVPKEEALKIANWIISLK